MIIWISIDNRPSACTHQVSQCDANARTFCSSAVTHICFYSSDDEYSAKSVERTWIFKNIHSRQKKYSRTLLQKSRSESRLWWSLFKHLNNEMEFMDWTFIVVTKSSKRDEFFSPETFFKTSNVNATNSEWIPTVLHSFFKLIYWDFWYYSIMTLYFNWRMEQLSINGSPGIDKTLQAFWACTLYT